LENPSCRRKRSIFSLAKPLYVKVITIYGCLKK
ncbi:hypothetical protein X975_10619, partial [Stegodyphus mimosarum]